MIVELELDLPGIEKVHLEKLVVAMRLHIAAKELGHPSKRLIVHVFAAQALFILGADIDIGNRLLTHSAPPMASPADGTISLE